jgi:membrane associated rhomboid family serine protease
MRSFGGRGGGWGGLPGLESMSSKLAVALVAGSVLFHLTKTGQGGLLLLLPDFVFTRFYLWQPFTYGFMENDPFGIIFGAIIIWSIGGWLEQTWGSKRLLLVAVGITALAGFLTAALAMLVPNAVMPGYVGGNVMTSVLWVAYGLAIGRGETNFWGIPLSGNAFAGIGAGFVVLMAIINGFQTQVPDILGLVLVFAYVRGASPKRLWLHLQHWRLQRQLRGRSKHLQVVPRDRPDRDQYLN